MSAAPEFSLDGDTLPPEPAPVKRSQGFLFELYRDVRPGKSKADRLGEPTFMDWMAQQ